MLYQSAKKGGVGGVGWREGRERERDTFHLKHVLRMEPISDRLHRLLRNVAVNSVTNEMCLNVHWKEMEEMVAKVSAM